MKNLVTGEFVFCYKELWNEMMDYRRPWRKRLDDSNHDVTTKINMGYTKQQNICEGDK